jgi:hypothetical protein
MRRLLTLAALLLGTGGTAFAQTPDIDMTRVHSAFWQMQGQNSTEALHWFEQEVNKYYHGEGYVSVASSQVANDQGQPMTMVTGFVDHDGVPGYNPDKDTTLFRFVQTSPAVGNQVNYEFLDTWGHVYYRGARAYPQTPFYQSYYGGYGFSPYYTSYARLGYLRGWRSGYRTTGAYLGWRTGFYGYRARYGSYIGGLRTTYGLSRYGYGVGYRFGYRGAYQRSSYGGYSRYGTRAYGGHYGGRAYSGRSYGGRRR